MTHEFKVGDRVTLHRPYSQIEIEGFLHSFEGGGSRFVFHSYEESTHLHHCNGRVPNGHGWYVGGNNRKVHPDGYLTLSGPKPKRVSGFGSFVKKIDIHV